MDLIKALFALWNEVDELEQLLAKCPSEIRDLIMSLNCVDKKIDFMQDRWSRWRDKLDEINENWWKQDV